MSEKENPEKIIDDNLRVLKRFYTDLNFNRFNIFLSVFEENHSKSIIEKKYDTLGKENNFLTFKLESLSDISNELGTLLRHQAFNPRQAHEEKYFTNTAIIVDFSGKDNSEKQAMLEKLEGAYYHLNKNTGLKLHFFLEKEDIVNLFKGSDYWEFRERVFSYDEENVSKVIFKQQLEETVDSKVATNKIKI